MTEKRNKAVQITLRPRMVLKTLLLIALLFIVLHISLQLSKFYGGPDKLLFFSNIFNVGEESTIPTWFSQFILLASAGICGFIAYVKCQRQEAYRTHWAFLGLVFLFLSIDEIAVMHEQIIGAIVRSDLGGGIDAWYLYAALAVGLVAIPLVRFWWQLPNKTKYLLVVSTFVYLFGAVFFDVWGGNYVGQGFLHEGFIVGIEELFEIVGACLFVYVLLEYATRLRTSVTLNIA